MHTSWVICIGSKHYYGSLSYFPKRLELFSKPWVILPPKSLSYFCDVEKKACITHIAKRHFLISYFEFAWMNEFQWNLISAVFVRWHLRWNQFCNHTLHTLQKGIYPTFACILWSLKPFSLLPKLLIKLTRFFLTGASQRNYSFLTPSGKKFSDRLQ